MKYSRIIFLVFLIFSFSAKFVKGDWTTETIDSDYDDLFITDIGSVFQFSNYIILTDPSRDIFGYLAFRTVQIPDNATINNAYIELTTLSGTNISGPTVTFYGIKKGNLETSWNPPPDLLSSPITTAYTNVDLENFTGYFKKFNITVTSIVNEIYNQYSWGIGNDIGFSIYGVSDPTNRFFIARELQDNRQAKLYIEYTVNTSSVSYYKGNKIEWIPGETSNVTVNSNWYIDRYMSDPSWIQNNWGFDSNSSTYNASATTFDGPFGEPWGNESFNGERYNRVYYVSGTGLSNGGLFGNYDGLYGSGTIKQIIVYPSSFTFAQDQNIFYQAVFQKAFSGASNLWVANSIPGVGHSIKALNDTTFYMSSVAGSLTTAEVDDISPNPIYFHEGQIYIIRFGLSQQTYFSWLGNNYQYLYWSNIWTLDPVTGNTVYYGKADQYFNMTPANFASMNDFSFLVSKSNGNGGNQYLVNFLRGWTGTGSGYWNVTPLYNQTPPNPTCLSLAVTLEDVKACIDAVQGSDPQDPNPPGTNYPPDGPGALTRFNVRFWIWLIGWICIIAPLMKMVQGNLPIHYWYGFAILILTGIALVWSMANV